MATVSEPVTDLKAGGDANLVTKLAEPVERLNSEEVPTLVEVPEPIALLHLSGQCAALPSFQSENLTICTWLRAANVPFKIQNHKLDLTGGRFPMVELGDDELGPPPENILEKLSRRLNLNLDEGLSQDQRILSYAMASTVEHALGTAHRRWCSENRGQLLRAYDLDLKRALKRPVMPRGVLEFFFKRSASRNEKSRKCEDVADERLKAVRMISEFLADRPYFFHQDRVTTLDVTVFGVLAPILAVSGNVAYPLRDQMILNYPNLVGFVETVKARLFPDWAELCGASEEGKCTVDKKHKLELDDLSSQERQQRKQQQQQQTSGKVLGSCDAETAGPSAAIEMETQV